MSRSKRARLVCAALILLCAGSAYADSLTIDLPTAQARARQYAPDAITALARIDQARAAETGAHVLFEQNPELDAGAGRRSGSPPTTAVKLRLDQDLELGRRSRRIAVADAGVREARAASEADLRELDLAVTLAFNAARHAGLAVEITTLSEALTTRAVAAAERRFKAGDLSQLDRDLAHIALGRARSSAAAARAMHADAIGKLAVLIGASPSDVITVRGSLVPAPLSLDALRATLTNRPDIRALEAETGVARAETDLANLARWPAVGIWFGYDLDEGDNIFVGGLHLTLPMWNREQGAIAEARVKQKRATLQRTAILAAAARQLGDAFEMYAHERTAVEIMTRDVMPMIEDAQALVERSIDTGQITISELLVIRQEATSARRELIDRELALANAAARARYIAGQTP